MTKRQALMDSVHLIVPIGVLAALFTFLWLFAIAVERDTSAEISVRSAEWSGSCVVTDAGASGKVLEVNSARARVGFPNGVTDLYLFDNLTRVACE